MPGDNPGGFNEFWFYFEEMGLLGVGLFGVGLFGVLPFYEVSKTCLSHFASYGCVKG